ncbi:MAG: hypothetical protein A3G25_01590 [Betaproteobacteria bacterium RIFCSPLOWO2_12_FULL_63_13]|nr:MAG: hypothetical protein A3H32_05225 [Betaproteobacteria bacterium RIFCSPLOWO2_02_FULL_63_19]OGA51194.1 MAG: hypothetical protein A3G25_01590 [Betaproteobacteria bacterium RIFCSPLOWO2_12_FULL_63_13]
MTVTEGTCAALIERTDAIEQAYEFMLAQPAIGSALIDNLNASLHLRSLLTDVFLIDSVFDAISKS